MMVIRKLTKKNYFKMKVTLTAMSKFLFFVSLLQLAASQGIGQQLLKNIGSQLDQRLERTDSQDYEQIRPKVKNFGYNVT